MSELTCVSVAPKNTWFLMLVRRSPTGTCGQTFLLASASSVSLAPRGSRLRGDKLSGPSEPDVTMSPSPAPFAFTFDFLRVDTDVTLSFLSVFP